MPEVDKHLYQAIEKLILSTFPSQSLSQLFIEENIGCKSTFTAQAHCSPY